MEITLILTSAVGEASNVTYPMTLKKTNKTKKRQVISSNMVEQPWGQSKASYRLVPLRQESLQVETQATSGKMEWEH